MGNDELINIPEMKNKFYLHVSLIGTNSFSDLDRFIKSFKIKNLNENVSSKLEDDFIHLFDFWDFDFDFSYPFEKQCEKIFDNIKFIKKNNKENNECLIVKVNEPNSYEVGYILKKINEIIDKDYMPLTLFLCDKTIIFSNKEYPFIDPRIIHTEKFQFTGDTDNEPIYRTLMTFCSIYHELGDKFTVKTKNSLIDYCLIDKIFPNNLNIICLGRIRQGKSTCTNCILNDMRARETDAGISQTKKMTYYQVRNFPIKILDLPGFENKETIQNIISELKRLKEVLKKMKDKVHIILYVIDFNSMTKFIVDEILIFNELIEHEDAKIIYVFTRSTKSTKKQILTLDKTEQAFNRLINQEANRYPNININKITQKIKISKENSVFLNFIEEDDKPKFGINSLFHKIEQFYQSTESYREALNRDIEKEALKLKERAKEEILAHKIGGALIGAIPIIDMIAQKYVIKKKAIKKIAQIFGIDLDEVENYINQLNQNNEEEEIINSNDLGNVGKNALSVAGNAVGASAIASGTGEAVTIITQTILTETSYIKFFSWELFKTTSTTVIDTSSQVVRVGYSGAKIGLGIVLSGVMSVAGIGLGAYFTNKELNELVEKFYQVYLIYGPMLSNSYLLASEYLERMELNN